MAFGRRIPSRHIGSSPTAMIGRGSDSGKTACWHSLKGSQTTPKHRSDCRRQHRHRTDKTLQKTVFLMECMLLWQAEEVVESAADSVTKSAQQPVQQAQSAAASVAEAVADKAPEPVSTIAHAAADTVKEEAQEDTSATTDHGGGTAQLAAAGEGGVADDSVKESEVAPASKALAPDADDGAAASQLDAAGESGVADDGVKESEVAPVEDAAPPTPAAEAAPAPQSAADHSAALSQLEAAGEDGMAEDGVKPAEVAAEAAAPAPAKAGKIDAKLVKQLRDKSGAGMMACKAALKDANGNFDKVRLADVMWLVWCSVLCIDGMASTRKVLQMNALQFRTTLHELKHYVSAESFLISFFKSYRRWRRCV